MWVFSAADAGTQKKILEPGKTALVISEHIIKKVNLLY